MKWVIWSFAWFQVVLCCHAWIPSQFRSVAHHSPKTTHEIGTRQGPWNSTQFGATGCWGRQPLLMRNAFQVESLPTGQDVQDMATLHNDDFLETPTCRRIQHRPGELDSYTVDFGPFTAEQCVGSETGTTQPTVLVVNDGDQWIQNLSTWIDAQFDFLPRWRRDDAQVSLSSRLGSIGPHVDNYDVFLIQTSGSKQWHVGVQPLSVEDEVAHLVPDSEVSILNVTNRKDNDTISILLKPGDCLYLPPRYWHWGIADSDDCVTLSIGCRAPSAAELVMRLAQTTMTSTHQTAVQRYTDKNATDVFLSRDNHRLSQQVKDEMKQLVRQCVETILDDDDQWDELVGRLVTEPIRPMSDYPTIEPSINASEDLLLQVLEGEAQLCRTEGVSMAWSLSNRGGPAWGRLYAQGQVLELRHESEWHTKILLDGIANGPPLNQRWFQELSLSPGCMEFVVTLLGKGLLYGAPVSI